jgi:SAM-dependent methyltransferase
MHKPSVGAPFDFTAMQTRYQSGEWRGFVFRDLVMDDLRPRRNEGTQIVALDIGCGHGFDGHPDPQALIASVCTELIGIEPDTEIAIPKHFSQVHHSSFEDAPIPPDSVDVAYAVMVLEHLDQPEAFLRKLHTTLKPGGVFWGFTVDSRHWFAQASTTLKKIGLKDAYLSLLHGGRGSERYENYPVHYLFNTPETVTRLTGSFSRCDVMSLWKRNQTHFYFPRGLKWMGNLLDSIYGVFGRRGSVLVVRIQK